MSLKREATKDDLRFFVAEMQRRFHARVFDKENAVEMEYVGKALGVARSIVGMNLPTEQEFMKNYATTIGPGIWIPSGWDLLTQIDVLVHVVEHVHQFWEGEFNGDVGFPGGASFMYLYVTEEEARVRAEQRAMRAQWEVRHLGFGIPLPHPREMSKILEGGYALSPASLKLAEDLAEAWITEVYHGKQDFETSKYAIKLLQTCGLI